MQRFVKSIGEGSDLSKQEGSLCLRSSHRMCIDSDHSRPELSDFAQRLKNQAKNKPKLAKPYVFKKKVPLPGAYPLNFSPYRLSTLTTSTNAVRLTPAEIYSDCIEIYQAMKNEFSSEYFAEEGSTDASPAASQDGFVAKLPSSTWSMRASKPRSSGRRVLSSLQLPVPKTMHEERKQLQAALKASIQASRSLQSTSGSSWQPGTGIEFGIEASSECFRPE